MNPIKSPKKLIEVALPLDAINAACAYEKLVKIGKPTSMHLWWARRPLAAARAVIFAQMVNDPGGERGYGRGLTKIQADAKREKLFKIIEDLVLWDNTNNEDVLNRARAAIRDSWEETCRMNKSHPQAAELFNPDKLPAFHDPFAGGGALPLEAQRLGLESWASDLNPVAVTINKAMIEIPPKFAGRAPVGPRSVDDRQGKFGEDWSGARGLAEDVRRYGTWMRDEAEKRIGHLYPKVEITAEMLVERPDLAPYLDKKLTVIAWLWARTVKSPNPAFSDVDVPLVSTFVLSSKEGKRAYIQPVLKNGNYYFTVRIGEPDDVAVAGTVSRRGALCLMSQVPIDFKYLRSEAKARRFSSRLMAIVAEGPKGRVYLPPTTQHEEVARTARPEWRSDIDISHWPGRTNVVEYGMTKFGDLFTSRQLVGLGTFTDLIPEATELCKRDAQAAGMISDGVGVDAGGIGADAYSEAIGTYLAFAVSRTSDWSNSVSRWESKAQVPQQLFGRHAIPMVWDYSESNILSASTGSLAASIENLAKSFLKSSSGFVTPGKVLQQEAQRQSISDRKVISTDPPYYDNIGYAGLSDFFYVLLRQSLRKIYPSLYTTVAVPKEEELVANPYQHGGAEKAEKFFLDGMTLTMRNLAFRSHPGYPVTIYYAFKQSETKFNSGTISTGWETFLQAVIDAGFSITGTWPLRTEMASRMIGSGANVLASSIVLVCRKRIHDTASIGRRAFIRELNAALPDALDEMTRGGVNSPVAPVDLSQAIIGPGMAIFSQYSAVLEADGSKMSVKTALQLINRFFAEDDFDHDTQFCLAWFEQHGWASGKYGEGDVLARAKGTSVGGLAEAGVVQSGGGDLRLLRWAELDAHWTPEGDDRTPVWEALHQLIRALNTQGESAAGALLARMPASAEPTRALAYRLYTLCERQGWAEEARAYNELVTAWGSIEAVMQEVGPAGAQTTLDI